jgi:hypothetical protein
MKTERGNENKYMKQNPKYPSKNVSIDVRHRRQNPLELICQLLQSFSNFTENEQIMAH